MSTNKRGRPPKAPQDLLTNRVQCLISDDLLHFLVAFLEDHGMTMTDFLRLGMYVVLKEHGHLGSVKHDATWDTIHDKMLLYDLERSKE